MHVKDIMSANPATVPETATIADAIALMIERRVSGLPVVNAAGRLVGILSEADLLHRSELGTGGHRKGWLRWLFEPGHVAADYVTANARVVGEVMTRNPACVPPSATLDEAVALMDERGVKRLPVVEDERLVGIVSRADIIRGLAQAMREPRSAVRPTDADIEQAVRAGLAAQNWAPVTIGVEVKDGVVRLQGAIFQESSRPAIRVLCENIDGVRAVEDHLAWIEPMSGTLVPAPLDLEVGATPPAAGKVA